MLSYKHFAIFIICILIISTTLILIFPSNSHKPFLMTGTFFSIQKTDLTTIEKPKTESKEKTETPNKEQITETTENKTNANENDKSEINAKKLEMINKYQARYFKIIKRNDYLLQQYDDENLQKDEKEIKNLFKEVENKINNNIYLEKYKKLKNNPTICNGETTDELAECTYKDYQKTDKLLNVVYQQVKQEINPKDFENIKISQRKWLKDKDNYFDNQYSVDYGSSRRYTFPMAEANMTLFRTLLLMLYL